MGAGASADAAFRVREASPHDLQAVVAELGPDDIARLQGALSQTQAPADPGPLNVTHAAGENEDGVDQELELELSKQELIFQKSLRKRAEREKQRKLEKEQRKAAAKAQNDKALEAAFDNEVDFLLELFDQGVEPETADEHGTTLLSEAAAGNAEDVLVVLLGEGCDPNSIGRYRRTPLWRAAYAGNAELIRMLLRGGSDPREYDEQGTKPIDVASNAESKELLLCWDTSATEKIQQQHAAFRKAKAKDAEKEERKKLKRQEEELSQAIEEAERKAQIARSELARARKLLQEYRQQKVSFFEQGAQQKLDELEPLLEGAECKVKLFEGAVQDWEWKMSRAKLKQSDFEQQKKEKEQKKAGKVQGFKVQIVCASIEELDVMLLSLNNDLDICADTVWENGTELKVGDALIKDGVFAHLRKSEFNKSMLSAYGRAPPAEPEGGEEEQEAPFPLTLNFSRGFNRTIDIRGVADVLLKDVGGMRAQDGRWPLVVDPSGRTSTFIQYTGAHVFHINDLTQMEPQRLCKALLQGLLRGGCLLIDLGNFDFGTDVVAEPFNNIEKGLFSKLVDRSVLYSYLLPRRFKSLIASHQDVSKEFDILMFLDDPIQKFVFGFVTCFREPEWDFAKQFYTISIRAPEDDEAAPG